MALECSLFTDINTRVVFKQLTLELKKMILSRNKSLPNILSFLEDLVSDSYLIVLRSLKKHDSSKKKLSSYIFGRVVQGTRKQLYAYNLPYGGIKALVSNDIPGLKRFLDTPMSLLLSHNDSIKEISEAEISNDGIEDLVLNLSFPSDSDDLRREFAIFIDNPKAISNKTRREELRLMLKQRWEAQ